MIQGEKVRLRAIERSDIQRFVRWLNDPEVTQFLLISSPLSTAMEEKWFDNQIADRSIQRSDISDRSSCWR